jgi:hypothetical protein
MPTSTAPAQHPECVYPQLHQGLVARVDDLISIANEEAHPPAVHR